MGIIIAWKVFEDMSKHILNQKSRLNTKNFHKVLVKRVVAQVCQTDPFALYFGIREDLMLESDS
ncbi:uncharacterized protein G2W53_014485 [Senna tora]|uniref:Uncharacterized protein n=1 Tax=Senna tora TaxID=362788 RepID=A0A834WTP0_9FABA|nr:uncharacterized protein G2W53_014485 [Senna tora]